jgi:hypothetical protein
MFRWWQRLAKSGANMEPNLLSERTAAKEVVNSLLYLITNVAILPGLKAMSSPTIVRPVPSPE